MTEYERAAASTDGLKPLIRLARRLNLRVERYSNTCYLITTCTGSFAVETREGCWDFLHEEILNLVGN